MKKVNYWRLYISDGNSSHFIENIPLQLDYLSLTVRASTWFPYDECSADFALNVQTSLYQHGPNR